MKSPCTRRRFQPLGPCQSPSSLLAGAFVAVLFSAPAFPGTEDNPARTVGRHAVLSTMLQTQPNFQYTINPVSGLPRTIRGMAWIPADSRGSRKSPPANPLIAALWARAVVLRFFAAEGAILFGMPSAKSDVIALSQEPAPASDRQWVVEVQQRLNGVPIVGAKARATVRDGVGVTAIQSSLVPEPKLHTRASVARDEAVRIAADALAYRARRAGRGRGVSEGSRPRAVSAALVVFEPSLFGLPGGAAALTWLVRFKDYDYFVAANEVRVLFNYQRSAFAVHQQAMAARFDGRSLTPVTGSATAIGRQN